jgi:hypothetical protein
VTVPVGGRPAAAHRHRAARMASSEKCRRTWPPCGPCSCWCRHSGQHLTARAEDTHTRRHATGERTLAAARRRAVGTSSQPRGKQHGQSPATCTAEPLPSGVWRSPHCLLAEAAVDALAAERRDPFLQLAAMQRDTLADRAAGWPHALGAFGVRHRGPAAEA